ncbi:MAG: M20/M25/M40 family metallo-hydrolase [Firmicutes bacterium]|nr:M20/M25/M40 family metallo-hydrolase [Bacillota bacterium]
MEILKHLNRLMEFKSVSEDRECCKEALKYVIDLASEFGFNTKMGRYGDVGIVDLGEGPETIGILVHVDVVSEGNPELWNFEPYALTEKDGILYGRGIVDDKGPVIASLYTMKRIKDENIPLKKKLRLIIGTSEEIYWSDMDHYKEEFEIPDYGYSPDGNFPIYNQENGLMDIELCFEEDFPEGLGGFAGGSAANAIPSYASYKNDGNGVEFTGKAAHSSAPELGVNAINLLCRKAEEEYGLKFAAVINKYFPEGTYETNLKFRKQDGTFSQKGDLTMVPTTLRQDGNNIYVNFNVRQCCEIPGKNILEGLKTLEDEYGCQVILIENLEPMWVDPDQPWIKRMQYVTGKFGMDTECLFAPGCSYAKCMPDFVGWGPVFPDDPDCAHMENEQQSLESFLRSLDIYTEYLISEGQSEPCKKEGK